MSNSPEMPTTVFVSYLHRTQRTYSVAELHDIARELGRRFEYDEATPVLQRLIAAKMHRLEQTN